MTPFEILRNVCDGAREVVLVAPYMRSSAVKRLPLAGAERLSVYLRGAAADFVSGASDLPLFQHVFSLGGCIYVCPTLHAKYYRADDAIFIGSSNLSERGLGLSIQFPNLEILAKPSSSFDWIAFEENLKRKSVFVTRNFHTALCEGVDLAGRNGLTIPSPDQLTKWTPQAARPDYVWDGYSNQIERIPLPTQRDAVSRDLKALELPKGLSKLAFRAWLRAILLTAPSTSSSIIARLTDATAYPIDDSSSQLALSWWGQLTAANQDFL